MSIKEDIIYRKYGGKRIYAVSLDGKHLAVKAPSWQAALVAACEHWELDWRRERIYAKADILLIAGR